GLNDTAEVIVSVGAAGPLAVCNWSPKPAFQGSKLTFDGKNSTAPGGATIKFYVWDFDDGSAQVPGNPSTHTYNVQSTFKPKLQVQDSLGRIGETTCADVVVGAPPICSADYIMQANPANQSCAGSNVIWVGTQMNLVENGSGTATATEQGFTDADAGTS